MPDAEAVDPTKSIATNEKKAVSQIVSNILSKSKNNSVGIKAKVVSTPKTTTASYYSHKIVANPVLPNASLVKSIDKYISYDTESEQYKYAAEKKKQLLEDETIIFNLSAHTSDNKLVWNVFDANKPAVDNQYTSAGSIAKLATDISSVDISEWYSNTSSFSTGLMAANVKFVHKYMDRIRIVLEIAPGINLAWWGRSEGSPKDQYLLATPYRFVIADFTKMKNPGTDGTCGYELWGARVFNSLEPLVHWDQTICHQSFNNNNCTGYNQTSIGWVCFYHRGENVHTIKDMTNVIMQRVGGGEAYNEVNMPTTQGTTFYKKAKPKLTYLHSPQAWEKKTEEEGLDWVFEKNQWVEIRPDDRTYQYSHVFNKTKPLTIGEAVYSLGPMYYPSKGGNTPPNFLASMLDSPLCDYISTVKSPQDTTSNFESLFLNR